MTDADLAWETVQYALAFGQKSGELIFRNWIDSLPRVDLVRLREVAEKLARKKKGDPYFKVTLLDVRMEYEHAGPARDAVAAATEPPCPECGTAGIVFVVRGGDTPGVCPVVSRHDVRPFGYVVTDTVPCVCERGATYRDRTKPGSDGGWGSRSWSQQRVKDLWGRCVFESAFAANQFVLACIDLRRAESGVELEAAAEPMAMPEDRAAIQRAAAEALVG